MASRWPKFVWLLPLIALSGAPPVKHLVRDPSLPPEVNPELTAADANHDGYIGGLEPLERMQVLYRGHLLPIDTANSLYRGLIGSIDIQTYPRVNDEGARGDIEAYLLQFGSDQLELGKALFHETAGQPHTFFDRLYRYGWTHEELKIVFESCARLSKVSPMPVMPVFDLAASELSFGTLAFNPYTNDGHGHTSLIVNLSGEKIPGSLPGILKHEFGHYLVTRWLERQFGLDKDSAYLATSKTAANPNMAESDRGVYAVRKLNAAAVPDLRASREDFIAFFANEYLANVVAGYAMSPQQKIQYIKTMIELDRRIERQTGQEIVISTGSRNDLQILVQLSTIYAWPETESDPEVLAYMEHFRVEAKLDPDVRQLLISFFTMAKKYKAYIDNSDMREAFSQQLAAMPH